MLDRNTIVTDYNNVVDTLKCVSISHGMVHSVSSGDTDTIDTSGNVAYPLVHIVPTSVIAGVQQITFKFNLLAMDLVKSDNSNEQQVLSDTLQILVDIIAQYKQGVMMNVTLQNYGDRAGDKYNPGLFGQPDDTDYTLEPFTERFDSIVSGWNCSFNIMVPAEYFACSGFENKAVKGETIGDWSFPTGEIRNCLKAQSIPKENDPVVFPEDVITKTTT